MAECHPVGFQWVTEAKARGATVIHVDPRFTRTSALADRYVPLRAGSDIAFVGGLINYVLSNEKYFREYVLAYTNAATIVTADFTDTEDADGVFSGLNVENRFYDFDSWRYQGKEVESASGERVPLADIDVRNRQRGKVREAARGESHGSGGAAAHPEPDTDETLTHPRCVFRCSGGTSPGTRRSWWRRHAVPQPLFAGDLGRSSSRTPARTALRPGSTASADQHTVGAQNIRAAGILQALLGNAGRPGGGILALRGHANIQGSTDIPTLFDLLPGYLPMPLAYGNEDLDTYLRAESVQKGFWANMPDYLVSLLKAWWGDAATADNDFYMTGLPRLTGSHSTYQTVLAQLAGVCKGYFLFGQNPAVGSANARMQRLGMASLDWLVVRDLVMIESATWWKNGPEIESGEMNTEDIATEVFFLPAAAHTEKAGSFTNTQRLLQWRQQAVEPAGDARSDLWFIYHLGRRIREKLAGSAAAIDRPLLDLTWDYLVQGRNDDPDAEAVLAEINGRGADGRPLSSYTQLARDGSTACGCWIYCGVYADGVNQAARRKPGSEQSWIAPEWVAAKRSNRRSLHSPASAAPGWPAVERSQEPGVVTPGVAGMWGLTYPTSSPAGRPPTGPRQARPAWRRSRGRTRSSRVRRQRGCSRQPDWSTVRCRLITSRKSRRSAIRFTGSSTIRSGRYSAIRTTATSPAVTSPVRRCSRT